jgi:hypothetical protein
MRPRSLDNSIPDQSVSLWIVVGVVVCLIVGIVLRALLAEWKREREQKRSNSDGHGH